VAIYEFDKNTVSPLKEVTFASQNILEQDIQRILRSNIQAIAPDCLVLAEEFGDWADSWRSIDLLCLDKDADLVVVELKRTENGGHMELQAIRYAAMVSKLTFADAVTAHSKFLSKNGADSSQAENAILAFLGWDEPRGSEFAQDVKIILVSAAFSKEITTSVLWLNERDLDIRCVRVRPYDLNGKLLVDIHQLLPLPEAAEYQVQLRKKAAEERKTADGGADWTRYDLSVGNETFPKLYKRQLFLSAVKAFVAKGIPVSKLEEIIPSRKFVGIEGQLSGPEFRSLLAKKTTASGSAYDVRRFYIEDSDLFFSEGKTWALSNQWSIVFLPQLDQLIEKYPEVQMSYSVAAAQAE
jgi:hypothetical protein